MLTDGEIEAVTGYPVKSTTPGSAMGIFENGSSGSSTARRRRSSIRRSRWATSAPGGRRYDDTFLAIGEGEPLTGLGDVARQDDVRAVNAVKGDTLVSVFLIAMGADNEDEMAGQLTQTALSHL